MRLIGKFTYSFGIRSFYNSQRGKEWLEEIKPASCQAMAHGMLFENYNCIVTKLLLTSFTAFIHHKCPNAEYLFGKIPKL